MARGAGQVVDDIHYLTVGQIRETVSIVLSANYNINMWIDMRTTRGSLSISNPPTSKTKKQACLQAKRSTSEPETALQSSEV